MGMRGYFRKRFGSGERTARQDAFPIDRPGEKSGQTAASQMTRALLLCACLLVAACTSRHVKEPPDTTLPSVASELPPGGASVVAISSPVSVTFSEAMDASTINASSFTLVSSVSGTAVTGTVAYDPANRTATFLPQADLSHDTPYTAAITTSAKDLAGNPIGSPHTWTFRTVPSPGSLDLSFGANGTVRASIGNDFANAVALQPDGKVLIAGYAAAFSAATATNTNYFTLVRFQENGSLDTAFGLPPSYGKVSDFPGTAAAVMVRPDGTILAAGSSAASPFSNADFLLFRYDAGGQLDTGFGVNGQAVYDMGFTRDEINAIAVQEDGKILAAGYGMNTATSTAVVARFTADGRALDASFGSNGAILDASHYSSNANIIKALPGGKILVGGTAQDAGGAKSFFLARYDQSGTPDATFLLTGSALTAPGQDPVLTSVAILPDGKIIAAGYTTNTANSTVDLFLIRYGEDGSPDASFGNSGNGTVMTDFHNGDESAVDVGIQPDGKVLVAARYRRTGGPVLTSDFALFRYYRDGTIDTTFGNGFGMVTTDFGSNLNDLATSMQIQQDGRVVVAGSSWNGSNYDMGLCRYWQ
jgi:uncharacterized delta-60 repeat protein